MKMTASYLENNWALSWTKLAIDGDGGSSVDRDVLEAEVGRGIVVVSKIIYWWWKKTLEGLEIGDTIDRVREEIIARRRRTKTIKTKVQNLRQRIQ